MLLLHGKWAAPHTRPGMARVQRVTQLIQPANRLQQNTALSSSSRRERRQRGSTFHWGIGGLKTLLNRLKQDRVRTDLDYCIDPWGPSAGLLGTTGWRRLRPQ